MINEDEGFMTETAINLVETVMFQIKFFMRDDTTQSVTTIVPTFSHERFIRDFKLFVEDAYEGNIGDNPESIYDVFSNLPELDFDITQIETGDIEWALYFPVTGFPSWLEGYKLQ